jgi:hypothetical protein
MTKSNIFAALTLGIIVFFAFLALYTRHTLTPPPSEKVSEEQGLPITVAVSPDQPLHIGIMGESRGDELQGIPFNLPLFRQFLSVYNKKEVQAVFFSGNLISAHERPKLRDRRDEAPIVIDNPTFAAQLKNLSALIQNYLGPNIPFFPVMGDREAAVEGASKSFREVFHLTKSVEFDDVAFAYSVSIGDAFFALIPTDNFNPKHELEKTFSSAMLEWLQQVLKEAAETHKYLFVVGHEPAFPTKAVLFLSSVEHLQQRDAFWKILVDNHVLAYFCSHELLFDRSNRHGVWQIISGGAGAPLDSPKGETFFHILILIVPEDQKTPPSIQLLNEKGEVNDEFELSKQTLFQQRIS